jgi:CDP-glycerol glycerophosphotransferase (TagB/SpsB family)
LIPAKELPNHALNAADVFLTKFSTMAIDAMILGVPTICFLLDKDKRWAIYGDAVDYAFTTDQLDLKLEKLRDPDCRKIWRDGLRSSQARFIEQEFPKPLGNNADLVARKVRESVDALQEKGFLPPSLNDPAA